MSAAKLKAAEIPPIPYEQTALQRPTEDLIQQEKDKWDTEQIRLEKLAALQVRKQTYSQTNIGICSCVIYAQSLGLGLSGYGLARNYPVNSKIPASTGFVVTYESKAGHIAKYILEGENLILQEANYSHCHVTSGRILPVGSKTIKGYIN